MYTRFGLESNYVDNKVGRATEVSWFRTYVAELIPDGVKKLFFYNLVIMYWIFIYMQFEYQCPKYSNVCRACAVFEGDLWILQTEGDV